MSNLRLKIDRSSSASKLTKSKDSIGISCSSPAPSSTAIPEKDVREKNSVGAQHKKEELVFPSGRKYSTPPSSTLESITLSREPSIDSLLTPRKFKSVECISSDAVSLNNHGVDAYRSGEIRLSLQYFKDAEKLLFVTTPQSPTSALFHPSRRKSLPRICHDEVSQLATCSCDQAATSNCYIYQRMEFDEGMNVHVDTIRLSEYDVDVEATISYNLGQGYRQNNDEYSSERAEAYYETCLEKCDKICELRVIALHNSGMIQYERGKTRDSIQTFTKVLGLAKLVWGHDHTNVATCYNCLGVLHYHLLSSNISTERDLNLAWHYSNAALDIQRAQFGRDHQNVATIYNNMGRLHVLNDQFEQALEMYEEALSIRGKVLGKDSLDYAATAFNAGQSYHQVGNLVQALELYNIFLSVASDKLSRNHRDIAVVLSGIAQIHQENGDHEDALKLYEESLDSSRNALGEYHSEVAMVLNRIGNFHFERDHFDEAFKAYSKGLEVERMALEKDHPNIVVTLCNLGEIHRQKKEWSLAISLLREALGIQQRLYDGQDHVEIAASLHVIGATYDKMGETGHALKYLQASLVMRRNILGDDDVEVAASLISIGMLLSRGNKFKVAMDVFHEALRIRTDSLGKDHHDVVFTLYNIALIHQKQGTTEKAIEHFTTVLNIERQVLGEHHKDVAITLYKLGESYKQSNNLDKSLQYFQEALDIERETMKDEDPITIARTLNEIGNIYLAKREILPMMEAFTEAARIYEASRLSSSNVKVGGKILYGFDASHPFAAPAA